MEISTQVVMLICFGSIIGALGVIASRLYDIARAVEKLANYHTKEYRLK